MMTISRVGSIGFLKKVILIFTCLLSFMVCQNNRAVQNKEEFLPAFTIKDINGKRISSREHMKGLLYVQFFDPRIDTDITNILAIDANWREKGFEIIAVPVNNKTNFSRFKYSDVHVVDPIYFIKLKKALNAPTCCESYFIFDKGHLIKKGMNSAYYENGLNPILNAIVGEKKSDLFRNKIIDYSNILNIPWLANMKKEIETEYRKNNLVVFFDDICDSCLSGSIIHKLNSVNNNKVRIIIVLVNKYTVEDIKIIRKQLNIIHEIYILNVKLENNMPGLSDDVRKINNTMILFNKNGDIVDAYASDCDCIKEFINKLEKILI